MKATIARAREHDGSFPEHRFTGRCLDVAGFGRCSGAATSRQGRCCCCAHAAPPVVAACWDLPACGRLLAAGVQSEDRPHQRRSRDEEDNQRLDHQDNVDGGSRLDLHLHGAGAEGAEQQAGGEGAPRRRTSQQCHRDGVKAVRCRDTVGQDLFGARHLGDAGQAGQGAGNGHHQDGGAGDVDPGGQGGLGVGPDGPEFEADGGPVQQPRDQDTWPRWPAGSPGAAGTGVPKICG